MIIDTLSSARKYFDIYPGMKEGLEFLVEAAKFGKANGKYELDGGKSYASIADEQSKGKGNSRLETHKKYIDIQFCFKGTDHIGWRSAGEDLNISEEYNPEKDVSFYSDEPKEWFNLSGDTFCIFFPHDAHAPLSGTEKLRKLVIKIAV